MPSRRIHVGQAGLIGGLARYAKAFDFLEVRCDPAVPSLKHLRRLKQEAPEGFQFSLVAGRSLAELSAPEPDAKIVAATREAATALGARWLLLRTPASATPSSRTRSRLKKLVSDLSGAAQGIAWEPRGIWSDEELLSAAEELGVTLVRDLAEQDAPPGAVVYTRLLGLGRNLRIGSGAIERLSERLEGAETGFVTVEGQGAVGVARALRGATSDEDEDGFEDDELDDDGDDGDDDFDDGSDEDEDDR